MVKYETLKNNDYFLYNNKLYKKIKGIIISDLYNTTYKIKPGAMVTPVERSEALKEKRRLIERRKKIDSILYNKK